MKLVKTASGKKTIKMSKKEWASIGKKAGWMKKAQYEEYFDDLKEMGDQEAWEDQRADREQEERSQYFDMGICPSCNEKLNEDQLCENEDCEEYFENDLPEGF